MPRNTPSEMALMEPGGKERGAMLFAALEHASLSGVLKALELGASPRAKNNYGCTALVWAAKNGDLEAAKALLDAGAPVDEPSQSGHRPLAVAAGAGSIECVRLFAFKGADLDARSGSGESAAMAAAWCGSAECAMELLGRGASALDRLGHPIDYPKLALDGGSAKASEALGRWFLSKSEKADLEKQCRRDCFSAAQSSVRL